MVADDDGLAPLHASSKLNTSRAFLQALQAQGRGAADRFRATHRQHRGQRWSLDLRSSFLQPLPQWPCTAAVIAVVRRPPTWR